MPPTRSLTAQRTGESATDLLLALRGKEHVGTFLAKWERNMDQAGYLEHTTAKREDCIRSYEAFLEPLWRDAEAGRLRRFPQLLPNRSGWADAVVETARRHRSRGVTPEMFIGCFETLVQAIEEIILEMAADRRPTREAVGTVRAYGDAMVAILVADWSASSSRDMLDELDRGNRLLTLQKNKYENILASTSDVVLVVDDAGDITEANEAARVFLDESLFGEPVWKLLDLDAASMEDVITFYAPGESHEISLYGEDIFFELKIAPLSAVSLASKGYLFLLTNITGHVRHREILEERVRERTAELETEKSRLEEMNITLRTVMRSIEQDRTDLQQSIASTVENLLLPTLSRLAREDSAAVRKGYIDILEDQLRRLHADSGSEVDARMLKLTPTEMKICQFIQAGSGSKDIAEAMNLSLATIQTHRRNIRRKFDLQGREINLYTYLQQSAHKTD